MKWIPTEHAHTTHDTNDYSGKNWQWSCNNWLDTWIIREVDSDNRHYVSVDMSYNVDAGCVMVTVLSAAKNIRPTQLLSSEYLWKHEACAAIVETLKAYGVTANGYSMFLGKE